MHAEKIKARAKALASLRSQATVFSGIFIQDSFSAMSASRTIQAASIFYLDNLLATRFCAIYQLLLVVLATFFCIDIFSIPLFSRFVVFNSLHSLFCISFSEFAGTSTNWTIPYLVSLCLVSVALFSCWQFQPIFYFIDIFSTHIFLDLNPSLQDEDKGGGLPHQVLLFTVFFFWNVHSSSLCTEGAVAISISCSRGTESPCYKVKLVIRTFLPGGNCHQEAAIISSNQTMPHHSWQFFY